MIIGNNNNDNRLKNNMNKGPNFVENNQNKSINPFVNDINSMQHSDPTNQNDMRDKSIAMLQDRLERGLISLDEFNQKVKNINKDK